MGVSKWKWLEGEYSISWKWLASICSSQFTSHHATPLELKAAQNRSPEIFFAFQDFLLKMPDWFYPLDQERQVDKTSDFKWRASTVFPRMKQPLGGLGYGRHLQTPTSLAQHLAILGISWHCILVAQGRHNPILCSAYGVCEGLGSVDAILLKAVSG